MGTSFSTPSEPRRPNARQTAALAGGIAAAGLAAGALLSGRLRRSFGASPDAIALVANGSEQYAEGTFANRLPSSVLAPGSMTGVALRMLRRGQVGRPDVRIPVTATRWPPVASNLAATWLGHASVLLEIDGYRILADPVFGQRVSPSTVTGPRRLHPAPIPVTDVPPLDAIVISHDHYDHLDLESVDALVANQSAPFVVPLGIGAHLRRWGVPEDRIVELDWDQQHQIDRKGRSGSLNLTCTEARHFSGRLFRRNTTLWSSWVIVGPDHRVFFGGDTGYTPAFADLGARFNGFDLTVLPIGAYDENWPDIHLNPEQAARTHRDLGGRVLLPIHWATFNLAFHRWAEPIERLLVAMSDRHSEVLTPRPGDRIDLVEGQQPSSDRTPRRWWAAASG